MIEQIKKIILGGENQKVEFKEAQFKFPDDAFETICAFLNTDGGTLLLGVDDDSNIIGVIPECIDEIKDKFASTINNPNVIEPTICLEIKDIILSDKHVLYVNVPESSSVHKYKNQYYKRNDKSDVNITRNHKLISDLYLSKETTYTENKIYPYLKAEDLRQDLINRVKRLAKLSNEQNDWIELDNIQFLKRNSLYRTDFLTGESGVTLAGILLFGTDEQIASVVPAFKFDLIKQVNDVERYDDRLTLRTNLLDCYDKAMKFIANNLPDRFYLEGTQRINLRENIFRELIANMIVHKEYIGAEPTKLLITSENILAENTSKPYIRGFITPDNITNHPKNPNIIKIFRGIGYVEELGSGISKMFKYCKEYAHNNPIIEEDNIFKFSLKHDFFPKTANDELLQGNQVSDQVSDQVFLEKEVLEFCITAKSLSEILERFGYKNRQYFRDKTLNPLLKKGLIKQTNPNSPKSPTQKYYTVIKKTDV